MPKRGLGKGLDALIPQAPATPGRGVLELAIDMIEPNSYQPRQRFDEGRLEELASSIRQHGVVQPIVVRKLESGHYELVAGERRWRACRMMGLPTIPAVVKELGDRELSEVALVENIQREDLNPLEEARAYRSLLEEFGVTQEEVARRVGKSRSVVANAVRLLSLPEKIKLELEAGRLSAGHARALLALEGKSQEEVAARVMKEGLNVRQTEELVKMMLERMGDERRAPKTNPKPRARMEPEIRAFAEKLQEKLGTRVRILPSDRGGKIEISYYGGEDLDRLAELLGVEES